MRRAVSCLLLMVVVIHVSQAAEVNVRYEKRTYYFAAVFNVEASPTRVMEVLTDYENITDLNAAIHTSELLEAPDKNVARIRTILHDCVLFFCRNITRVEDVIQDGNRKLEAFLIPMLSDLQYGYAAWKLTKNVSGTTVHYDAEIKPKFWIPPIIRSIVLTNKFKTRVTESVEKLQTIAEMPS